MVVFGIIMLIAGIACAVYGNSLNNSLEAQLESLFSNGSSNPGDMFLYVGIVVAVIGAIIFVSGLAKNKK